MCKHTLEVHGDLENFAHQTDLRLQAVHCPGQDGSPGAKCGQLAEEGHGAFHFGRPDADALHLCCVIKILCLGLYLLVSLLVTPLLVQSHPLVPLRLMLSAGTQ